MTDNWEGVKGSAEHRTLGNRAWCHDDRTYCYRSIFCLCCLEASPDWKVCSTCYGEGYEKNDR